MYVKKKSVISVITSLICYAIAAGLKNAHKIIMKII